MAAEKQSSLNKLIIEYLESAKERLASSEQLIKIGNYRDAISRAYYAFLDAADAALLTKDVRSKSHAGSISQFGMHFIKTNLLDKKYNRWFRKIERARLEADYERQKKFTPEDAEEALREAKEFVAKIEDLTKGH